jgi:aspartate kinase
MPKGPTSDCQGIVLKYGGTLLGAAPARDDVVEEVRRVRALGVDVVVVVSAMGRRGSPYATDTLLDLLAGVGPDVLPRTRDLMISCGETISAALMAHQLSSRGVAALPFDAHTAGVRTTDRFGNAAITAVEVDQIRDALRAGVVPVVAGFQGVAVGHRVTTLGRGGSDLTAVALAGVLGARAEIVKEVPGIMTCDPRWHRGAQLVPLIRHRDARRLAELGASVLNARAAAFAASQSVPLLVRMLGSGHGTLVTADAPAVTAMACRDLGERTLVSVVGPGLDRDTVRRAGAELASSGLEVRGVESTADAVTYTVPASCAAGAVAVLHDLLCVEHVADHAWQPG